MTQLHTIIALAMTCSFATSIWLAAQQKKKPRDMIIIHHSPTNIKAMIGFGEGWMTANHILIKRDTKVMASETLNSRKESISSNTIV